MVCLELKTSFKKMYRPLSILLKVLEFKFGCLLEIGLRPELVLLSVLGSKLDKMSFSLLQTMSIKQKFLTSSSNSESVLKSLY